MKIAIIGAGFSGLLAGYLLQKEGVDVTVYEKNDYLGGHCKTLFTCNTPVELGTICAFKSPIKDLLISLKIDYTSRLFHRNFVDENYQYEELISREDIPLLTEEIERFSSLITRYSASTNGSFYEYIHPDLLVSIHDFLQLHDFVIIQQLIAPHLASFGYGNMKDIPALYAIKIFDKETLYSFIMSDKLHFINNGMIELIQKLGLNISDIRSSLEVTNIEETQELLAVDTAFSRDFYDKVIITSPLSYGVIKNPLYNDRMAKLKINTITTCVFEVNNMSIAHTYYKANLGIPNRMQFFYVTHHQKKTLVTTHAYGHISTELVENVIQDLSHLGIIINHLSSIQQWNAFPHFDCSNIHSDSYSLLNATSSDNNLFFIGSLVTKPSLSAIYVSVKDMVKKILNM